MLLIGDGTLSRFWPEPVGLRTMSWKSEGPIEYVSSVTLDPAGLDNFLIGSHNSNLVELVKSRLAHAVVAYDRRVVRRS